MQLPKVQEGVFNSVLHEQQTDPHWATNVFTKIYEYDPVMAAFIAQAHKELGGEAAFFALTMYRVLKSQLEADSLTELIG